MLTALHVDAPITLTCAPPLLSRLTAETQAWHGPLDARLYAPVITPTLGGYRYFLATIYGFQAAVDCELRATIGLDRDFLEPRLRATDLAADLMVLGLTPAECQVLARRPHVPAFPRAPEALGWMYVTERLTLKHDVLRDRLINQLPNAALSAGAYVTASRYARASWRELASVLDYVAPSPAIADRVVNAAKVAFAELDRWLAGVPAWDGF